MAERARIVATTRSDRLADRLVKRLWHPSLPGAALTPARA
jgi:hypothetical protein